MSSDASDAGKAVAKSGEVITEAYKWYALGEITKTVEGALGLKAFLKGGEKAEKMLGEAGTQMHSKSLWSGADGLRIDVENAAPGVRPAQIHIQQAGTDIKYLYDPATGKFAGAPRALNKLLEKPEVQRAIQKGLRFLGE